MPRLKRFGKRKSTGNMHTKDRHNNIMYVEKLTSNNEIRNLSEECNNNNSSSCSSSKNKLKYLNMVGNKTDYIKCEMQEGNVIIDLEILSEEILKFVSCRNCSVENSVKLFEYTNKRKGIVSNLALLCTECNVKTSFMTSRRTDTMHYDNNIRLVYGLRSIGKGQKAAETLISVINLPQPPSKFYEYNSVILKTLQKVSNDSMMIAVREAISENNGDSDISVALDGTWHKRGHTSLHGVVTVTSLDSGKVLDVETLSKYCPTCKSKQKSHPNCQINHTGSSGSMEVAGVTKLFERSTLRDVPVRYVKYLGDGDSMGFDSVIDSNPYGESITLEKLECINHVQKRMGSRLRRLTSKVVLGDGKKLSGQGRLTDKVIDSLQEYYGNAIRQSNTLDEMKKACWATFFHKSSTDAEPQHGLCPIDYVT